MRPVFNARPATALEIARQRQRLRAAPAALVAAQASWRKRYEAEAANYGGSTVEAIRALIRDNVIEYQALCHAQMMFRTACAWHLVPRP